MHYRFKIYYELTGNFLYTLKNSPTRYTAPPSGKPRLNALPSVFPACVNHAGDSIKNIRKWRKNIFPRTPVSAPVSATRRGWEGKSFARPQEGWSGNGTEVENRWNIAGVLLRVLHGWVSPIADGTLSHILSRPFFSIYAIRLRRICMSQRFGTCSGQLSVSLCDAARNDRPSTLNEKHGLVCVHTIRTFNNSFIF